MANTPYQTTVKTDLGYPGSSGNKGIQTVPFFVNLADIAAADLLKYTPGFKFVIEAVDFSVTKAATTAAKAATVTPKIGTTAITGGVLALTSANCTPAAAVVSGSAVTGANSGSATDSITLTGSSVTAFVEGNGVITLSIRNVESMDGF